MDEILAAAKDVALQGVQEIAPAHAIGLVHHVRAEEERLSTHLFECTLPRLPRLVLVRDPLACASLPRGNDLRGGPAARRRRAHCAGLGAVG